MGVRRIAAVVMSLAGGALGMPGLSAAAAASKAVCSNVYVPVAITPGQPRDYRIYGLLCLPAGETPSTIQLLVPGITYTHLYWAFPDPTGHTDRYNYTDAAIAAGADCSSADALLAGERPYYGPDVPSLRAYVLPDAGHDLNMAIDAPDYFTTVQRWIDQNVGGAGKSGNSQVTDVSTDFG